jgi:hypothetical protein
VQTPHQVQISGAGLGPCAIDGDELGVVSQRLDHAVGIMAAPRVVEPQFDFADRIFVCRGMMTLQPCE